MVENSITLDKISHIDCTIQLGNTVEPSYKEPFYKELVLDHFLSEVMQPYKKL